MSDNSETTTLTQAGGPADNGSLKAKERPAGSAQVFEAGARLGARPLRGALEAQAAQDLSESAGQVDGDGAPDGETIFRSGAMEIIKGAGWFGAGTAAGMLLEYLTQGLLASRLGAGNFGLYSTGYQVFSLALVLALLALPNTVSYFIPRNGSDRAAVNRIISTGFWITLAGGLAVGALMFLLAQPFAAIFSNEPQLASVVRLFALALPPTALVMLLVGVLRGLKQSRQASLLSFSYDRLLRLGFTVLLLLLGFGLGGAVLAFLPASLGLLAVSYRYLRRAGGRIHIMLPRPGRTPGMLSYTWPLLVSQLLTNGSVAVQPFLLLFFLDARAVGIFTVARFVPRAFSMVLGAFNFLYFPVVSGNVGKGALKPVRRIYRLTTSWSLLLVWPTYLLVMAFPEAFLTIFGAEYSQGAMALRILITGALINVASGMVGSTLLATGKTRIYLMIEVLGISASLGFSYLLIPTYGLTGAATAALVSGFIWNLTCLLVVYRLWGIQPFDAQYSRILLAGLAFMIPIYPITRILVDWTPWSVFLMAPVFSVLTVYVLVRFKLLNKDSRLIMTELGKVPFKLAVSIRERYRDRFG
jgi:O-antigen/teichoic acid export membrane protein